MNNQTNICRVLEVNFQTKEVEKIIEIKTTFHLNYDEYNIKVSDNGYNTNKIQEFYLIDEAV